MAHVIVLGGAGSGKSVCLARRAAELAAAGRGGEVLVLVPSRQAARLFAELVLEQAGRRALVGPRIMTLGALAREVRRAAGGAPGELLSAAERRDLVAALALAAARSGTLRALGASAELPGFAAALERLIAELRAAGAPAAGFGRALQAAARAIGSAAERRLLAAKAADLYRLYAEYGRRLAAGALTDEEGELLAAAQALRSGQAGLPGGARCVLLDGFAQFTAAQEQLVVAALSRAGESLAALCFDGDGTGRLGHVGRAWRAIREARKDWAELRLEGSRRFQAPELAALEQLLFTGKRSELAPRSIELLTADGLAAECEAVARRAAGLVRDGGFRPEEIAVFARRLSPYAAHLERAFRLAGVPLDFAESRSARELAAPAELAAALRAALPGAAEEFVRWLRAAADLDGAAAFIEALRGPLAGQAERRGAAELAALAAERGLASTQALQTHRARLGPEGRQALDQGLRQLGELGDLLPRASAAPAEWAAAGAKCLAKLDLARRLLGAGWPAAGLRRELAALEALGSALAGAARAAERAGTASLGLGDYLRLLESALAGRSLPAAGARSGTVLAANVFESRTRQRRAVFVLGLAEGSFPREVRENPLLGDRERRLLAAEGLELPLAAEAAEQERYLFYIAATRARERLYLSSAAPAASDRQAIRSFFLDEVEAVFPPGSLSGGAAPSAAEPEGSGPPATKGPDLLISGLAWKGEALSALAAAFNTPRPADAAARRRWRSALALHEQALAAGLFTEEELARLAPRRSPPGELADERAREALRKTFAVQTASGLSAFENCPFAHFLLRGLGLSARPRLEFDARLAGELLHAALGRAYARARDGGVLPKPEEAGRFLRQALGEDFPWLADQPEVEPFLAAQVPLLRRLLAEDAERFAAAGTRPAHLELVFGGGRPAKSDDPASRRAGLALAQGLELRGRIDRVDLLADGPGAVVIDYKRSMKSGWKDDPQAILYALALGEVFGLEPAGAGFLGLRGGDKGRVGGFLRPELRERLAAYGFKGRLDPERLEAARKLAAELARRAAAGDVRVWPADCSGCPDQAAYNPICRFQGAEWRAELGWAPPGEADGRQE